MLNKAKYLLLTTVLSFSVTALPAKAERICKVTDPTGTPLNVRAYPNGDVINALRNGREVDMLEFAYDDRGRPWVKVGGYYQGTYRIWGWVIREFISCYDTY